VSHVHAHGHSHGLVDPSIKRSRAGLTAVGWALLVLGLTAAAQTAVFVASGSVALLADLIHNFGDAATAIPLAIAFALRSARAERWAGLFVVAAIFVSACVAGVESVHRLIDPREPEHLVALAAAGVLGFAGNWIAARIRTRAGRRLDSPALIADGDHARADAYVSLAVVASAAVVALGLDIADPLIGLAITLVILRITWHSWQTVRTGAPRGELMT
jgi:cation diffusion facilitator family transporter